MTAGTKDKRGITSQLVTVKNVDPKKLLNSVRNNSKIALGNFSYCEQPLQLGQLKVKSVMSYNHLIALISVKNLSFVGKSLYYSAEKCHWRRRKDHRQSGIA